VEFVNVDGLGAITGSGNTFNGNQYGIALENSSHILVDGVSRSTGATINNNGVAGILINGGGSNTISNITVNHNGIGIPENFFNGGVGVNLTSTTANMVTNVVLSEDAFAGMALSSSSSNTINQISVHYPDFYGVVIDGGSGNTIQNSAIQSADYVAIWFRDGTRGIVLSETFSQETDLLGRIRPMGSCPTFLQPCTYHRVRVATWSGTTPLAPMGAGA
jgi:parallel beta-helix repeat protein